ncbi:MAG: YebC/PmpR family DNA-binding transcriptional regulator [Candidatus Dojkabacteria bacterium]
MSGHSKWSKIKRKKGANDAKRGAVFTKLGRDITMAAQESGGDPDTNFSLRLLVKKAKSENMPIDNIERAIKRGTGELEGGRIERVIYEFVGNNGLMGIVAAATDNTNRTVSELKNLIESKGGKLADPGSVAWQFSQVGLIQLRAAKLKLAEKFGQDDTYEPVSQEELELELMDIDGVLDYEAIEDGVIQALTSPEKFAAVLESLNKLEWDVVDSELSQIANAHIVLAEQAYEKAEELISEIEGHDDVSSVWTNLEN